MRKKIAKLIITGLVLAIAACTYENIEPTKPKNVLDNGAGGGMTGPIKDKP